MAAADAAAQATSLASTTSNTASASSVEVEILCAANGSTRSSNPSPWLRQPNAVNHDKSRTNGAAPYAAWTNGAAPTAVHWIPNENDESNNQHDLHLNTPLLRTYEPARHYPHDGGKGL